MEKSDYDPRWIDLIGAEFRNSQKIKMIPEEPGAVSTGIEDPGGIYEVFFISSLQTLSRMLI